MKQSVNTIIQPDSKSNLPATIAEAINISIQKNPEDRFIEYSLSGNHSESTYGELWDRSSRIASGLLNRGLRSGSTAILLLNSALDFTPTIWACFRLGILPLPTNSQGERAFGKSVSSIFQNTIEHLDQPIIIGDRYFQAICNKLTDHYKLISIDVNSIESHTKPPILDHDPSDLACLIQTSGTTSSQKIVALTNETMVNRYNSIKLNVDKTKTLSPVRLGWFPFDGLTGMNMIYPFGGSYIYLPTKSFVGQPTALLDAISAFKVTYLPLSSFSARLICRSAQHTHKKWALGSLQTVGLGAEFILPKVMQELSEVLEAHGAKLETLGVGYGMTETGLISSGSLSIESLKLCNGQIPVSLGHCTSSMALRIVGKDNSVKSESECGHIQVFSSKNLFSGYYHNARLTRESFTSDGWFQTGDMGFLSNNQLTITGRSKDIICINAKKHALVEIEIAVTQVIGDSVHQVIACAINPSESNTEELVIFIASHVSLSSIETSLAKKITHLLSRQYSIHLKHIVPILKVSIPRTSSGKIRRSVLVQNFVDKIALSNSHETISSDKSEESEIAWLETEALIKPIWKSVLALNDTPNRSTNFFDMGGDSLKLAQIVTQIELKFERVIPLELFMLNPTIGNLAELLHSNEFIRSQPNTETSLPIENEIIKKLKPYIEAWDGERLSKNRLVMGLNTKGRRTPLFWVFQGNHEFTQLSAHLGTDQPVFGFRSGHLVMKYDEDSIQTIALKYVQEIIEVSPVGPLILGGNCQGGIIALAVAQHLLRRGRHIQLLVLMEWAFPIQPFQGSVLMLFGRDSLARNPYLQYHYPHFMWRRAYSNYLVKMIEGGHGHFFEQANVSSLANILTHNFRSSKSYHPLILPHSSYQVQLKLIKPMTTFHAGEKKILQISVENISDISWHQWRVSGLMLGNQWINSKNESVTKLDGRVGLPALKAGENTMVELIVNAPNLHGRFELIIDVVEEGNLWFQHFGCSSIEFEVLVSP